MTTEEYSPKGFILGIVHKFLTSQMSIILIILSLCLGIAAVLVTPREEEPQIVVPMADVMVSAPGSSPEEVEKLVATPLERLLWQIDGVEYVYSISSQDKALIIVRFFVGENREDSIFKLHNKISMNIDRAPPIVKGWVVKPVEIDDVPIVNITLFSERYNDHELHRIGEEVLARLSEVKDISRTEIIGGRKREVRVELLPEKMASLGVSFQEVQNALQGADASVTTDGMVRANTAYTVSSHSFLTSSDEVAALVVGVQRGRPVYLRDIAEIIDGPEEVNAYSRIGYSHYYRQTHQLKNQPLTFPAVTLALAKKRGTNAVVVSEKILAQLDLLKKSVIPDGVHIEITRNYGQTAQEKVDGLLSSLTFAVISVVILLAFTLGWREALVVAVAVPISFSLALFVNFLLGFTINRVTLFALILSLGLVVDDPITNVDNIQRHIWRKKHNPLQATLFAVQEVLPPVIMSTIAIILSFTPLFFITGMMGPYMAPMASNVPITVIFSTGCALTIVPWLSYLLLRKRTFAPPDETSSSQNKPSTTLITRMYRRIVAPFLNFRVNRWLLLLAVLMLMGGAVYLALARLVPLKLLPFDNKNEFQIVIDMPEGTTLETTNAVVLAFEDYLRTIPEATNFVSYVGCSSAIDFNGLVRHYYLRQGGHLADIRINLADKAVRQQQSHAIVLRLRKDLEKIAKTHHADIKIVELPPGPPVMATLVEEVYGDPDKSYEELIDAAAQLKNLMATEPFVVDIDDTTEASRERCDFIIDKEKAALHGITATTITQTLKTALSGSVGATVHATGERTPLLIKIILPRTQRSSLASLTQIPIKGASGAIVSLGELIHIVRAPEAQPIYHKNLERVVYVTGEMAGRAPAEAVLDMQKRLKENPLPDGIRVEWAGEGEWKITLRVFRDMGIAFAAAMVGIYILLIVTTDSFFMPVLIMMAIPLTLIGAMPGFWLLNIITDETVGGFGNPVFFTATSMIGMIALGGIVIRNSLILIEFIQEAVQKGMAFKEAILQSGAIRMRPILLTAATTAMGAIPITFDPVFSGLAWCLIFGLLASTLFTLVVIPVTYFALYQKKFSLFG